MNGVKEFLLHNGLGPEDLHYQYTNVSVNSTKLSQSEEVVQQHSYRNTDWMDSMEYFHWFFIRGLKHDPI